jgi:transposase InsO family protein
MLRQAIAELPRNTTAAYVRRLRRVHRCRLRRRWRTLHWRVPGTVWAIDGTWFDQPVLPLGRRALIVVELESRQTLCVESVSGERATAVVACLERLIAMHGAPLVLKADNGSAFVSERVAELCARHGITLMHSPIRRPRWNGTCEVSGRWAKHRAHAAAGLRGSPDQLCQADLDCAVTFTGAMPRIDDALRLHFRAVVAQQLAAVVAERGLVMHDRTHDHVHRSLARVAVQRALQLCHILTIEGREYRRSFPAPAA